MSSEEATVPVVVLTSTGIEFCLLWFDVTCQSQDP